MALDPAEGTPEAEKLKLLGVLVERYEKGAFPISSPNPIDAIVFRMEERGLKQSDLIQYIGSKSKVSEVLSGKRNLTLQMIRLLSQGLSIPIDLLIEKSNVGDSVDISKYPISPMKKLGWISGKTEREVFDSFESLFKRKGAFLPSPVMFRKTFAGKGSDSFDVYSLHAWAARVLKEAEDKKNIPEYDPGLITEKFLRGLSNLSLANDGPRLAMERLLQFGIVLLIVQHLPKTKLDGASFFTSKGNPIVGMTLRFDRIDNFWFTLMHELVHIKMHLKKSEFFFFDDIDSDASDELEKEADFYATEYLISRKDWTRSALVKQPSEKLIFEYSKIWNVHPAIIAGQVRREKNNYINFSKLIGQGEVRRQFEFVPVR
ncbi:MAG TPA: ImmA/IrrE family metallo-endopeptidase [bacterium]|nr:ImmA/IrrE family metallo-endopeptidase [bacterium]